MKNFKYISVFLLLLTSCKDKVLETNTLEQIWNFQYQSNPSSLSLTLNAPTRVSERQVALTIDSRVTLIEIQNGEMLWSKNLGTDFEIKTRNILSDDDHIYIKFDDTENIKAYNISDGEIGWNNNFDNLFDDFVNDYLFEEKLYLTNDNPIISIVSTSGEFVKELQLNNYPARSILVDGDKIISSQGWQPTGSNNSSGRIIAYSESTNELLWSYDTNSGGYYFSPILLKNEIIISGTTLGTGEIVGLNLNDGNVIWSKKAVQAWSLATSDTSVFVNDGESIVALDLQTGQELWRTNFNSGFGQDNIFYFENKVFHSHGSGLFVLNASTGEIIYTEQNAPDGTPFGNLTIADEKLFIQSDRHLYAYEIIF